MVLVPDPYRNGGFDVSQYSNNDEWILSNSSATNGDRFGSSNIKFHMYFTRKPLYYVINIAFPIIMLSVMSLGVFWLPPSAGEKMGLSTVIFLSYSVFSLIVVQNLPTTSDSLPLLGETFELSRNMQHMQHHTL